MSDTKCTSAIRVFLGFDGEHERLAVTVSGVRFHLDEFCFRYPCERRLNLDDPSHGNRGRRAAGLQGAPVAGCGGP
jgi:hypothetical protein